MEIWECDLPFEPLSPVNEMISQNCAISVSDQIGFPDVFMNGAANTSNDSNNNNIVNNNTNSNNSLCSSSSSSKSRSSNSNMIHPSKNDLFICQQLNMDEEWPSSTLPTPPRSPENNSNALEDEFRDHFNELIGEAEVLDLLECMELDWCPLVEEIMVNGGLNGAVPSQHPTPDGAVGTQELRHDCMWSGKCDDTCKQRIRYSSENSDIQLLTPASSPLRTSGMPVLAVTAESAIVSDFVDPSAVMSYTPHADHSYYQHEVDHQTSVDLIAIPQITVATSATSKTKSLWTDEQYDLSDSPSESDESEVTSGSENIEDEEEIDVVSVQSAPVRAHQRHLAALSASAQRSLLKSKNLMKTAAHKQKKQKTSSSAPATPYLLTPVQSPQPSNPAGPIEYPMPKVTSSGRVVQPTNRSASFLEAQPQHSSRNGGGSADHHRRKRKSDHTVSTSRTKASRSNGVSSRAAEVEDPEKRREHNSMERKRRDDLRSAFQRLRELVPEIQNNQKAAKVVILAKAAEYSQRLQHDQKTLEAQSKIAFERNKRLRQNLDALQQHHQHQQLQHHYQQQQQRSSSLNLNTMRTLPV